MESLHPNHEELSAAEKELERLHTLVGSARADGVTSGAEQDRIWAAVQPNDKVTAEELELVRTLIFDKVATKEVRRDSSS
ncbi:hypothetical protein [Egbenema bharatensis]|uniref:hypothetical protein n=1 Tax=Egbenema bharatensis TaxID=3463334 RepID=UPI003A853B40